MPFRKQNLLVKLELGQGANFGQRVRLDQARPATVCSTNTQCTLSITFQVIEKTEWIEVSINKCHGDLTDWLLSLEPLDSREAIDVQ